MTALIGRFDLKRLSLGKILPGAAIIGGLTVAVILSGGLYERASTTVSAQMAHYGSTLAKQIAALAAEPLMAGDRVALNRIVTLMGEAEEVVTVGVYTIDNRALASFDADATRSATAYSAAITFDETIAGYVRVGLDRAVFERSRSDFLLWALLISVVAIAAVLGMALAFQGVFLTPLLELRQSAFTLARERGAETLSDTSHTLGELTALAQALAPVAEDQPVERDSRGPLYAIVLNIFNQVSLPRDERREVLNLCRKRAQKVCRLHHGRALSLPGTGVVALFDASAHEDHAFQAIFAALLIRDLIADLNHTRLSDGHAELLFRLALDPLPARQFTDADEQNLLGDLREELQHTVLLSATARNGTVAIGQALYDSLLEPSRLQLSEQRSAALHSLANGGMARCYLVQGVAESYGALLDRQAELLLYEA